MNEERLEYLLDRYFNEALTEDERAELESQLLAWPQARALFWKRARFNSLLRRRGRENWGRRLAIESLEPQPSRWRTWWERWRQPLQPAGWWAAGALAVILVAFSLFKGSNDRRGTAVATSDSTGSITATAPNGQGVATILRAVGVTWGGNVKNAGNVLGPGWLRFERGLVEVQFHRGARVVIEGPAEFELISDMQARCLLGKVRAEVPPPAIGFEILSPNVRVVDRGTAFGLEVQREGPAEVHVFSGKVDLATSGVSATSRQLGQGTAVRVDTHGELSDIPSVSQDFMTADAVEKQATTAMVSRFKAWRLEVEAQRRDPSLMVQYTFDSFANRKLHNFAPGALLASHGTIIGCGATEGRWPGKKALDFKQLGDRIRFAVPNQLEALTCVTWIRLDAFDRPYSALLMAGDAAVGEMQWQIGNHGQLLFGKRKQSGWGFGKLFSADSAFNVLGPRRCGSWMQLALVYDAHSSSLSHYLDGQQVSRSSMDAKIPLKTGALEIGNWTPASGDPYEPIRAFNGRMDEFAMYSRALSAAEIQHLWEVGKPL